ncbi:MAG TPA: Calx-beta domain-containing protein [Chitinispirillaceae bacterium]|nr:Calx-beta domain-containing protein [Chitinispirillaceae bacterium]
MAHYLKAEWFSSLFLGIGLIVIAGNSDQICEMKLRACPETYDKQTIEVPANVTTLSSDFFVCMPSNVVQEVQETPSIMFVIDHSGSMSGLNGDPTLTDPTGSRFKVTNALIDTINNMYPKAEIGLIVFQEALYFDAENLEYVKTLPETYPYPAGHTKQGYIPLMRLDSTLANGQSAYKYLKTVLNTKDSTIRQPRTVSTDLVYHPPYKTDANTNINTAFDAARLAMLGTTNDKENQFIIFLSDGVPTSLTNIKGDNPHANKDLNDFQKGTDLPTTFTVYFVRNTADGVPASIQAMTDNIRANNYSKNNSLSNVWSIKTSYDTLLNVMMNQAINPIFSLVKREPTRLILNSKTYDKYNSQDSSFYVPGLVLQNERTNFDLSITYKVRKDTSTQLQDTTVHITFDILRNKAVKEAPKNVDLVCRDTIYYKVSVKATDPQASELGPDNGAIQFTRDNSDHGDLVVYFTVSGTAIPDKDYKSIPDSVVFTGDQKNVSYTITPLTDSLKEDDETVIVTLSTERPGRTIRYSVATSNSATVSISDHFVVSGDTVTLAISPNPYPLKDGIPIADVIGKARVLYENILEDQKNGVLIAVRSTKRLKQLNSDGNSYGTAIIYDAVGNIVKDLNLRKGNDIDSINYGMVWDGTNNKNRTVGGGMYLINIKITNTEEVSRSFTRKIGVKY